MELEFQRYTDPWLHYSIPNFLSDDMFKVAEDTANKILDFKTQNHRSMINYNHDKNFRDYFLNLYSSFCDRLEIPKLDMTENEMRFQYVSYNNCTDYEKHGMYMHTDSFDKQLSCLIPISITGSGTELYDDNKKFVKEVEWKKNTAFLFANKPNHWHVVGSSIGTTRCLLNVLYMPKGYSSIHEKLYNVKRPKKVK